MTGDRVSSLLLSRGEQTPCQQSEEERAMDSKHACEFCPPANANACCACFRPVLSQPVTITGFLPQHHCCPQRGIVAGIGAICLYLVWRLVVSLNLHYPVASGLLFLADIITGRCPMGFLLVLWNREPVEPASTTPFNLMVNVWIPAYNKDLSILRRTITKLHDYSYLVQPVWRYLLNRIPDGCHDGSTNKTRKPYLDGRTS